MKKMLIAFSALTLVFTACKKDKDEEPANITPTQQNLVGTYVMTAATMNGVNVFNNTDANMNMVDACERDDEYKLNADLSYQQVDAGTACNPSTNWTGDWALINSTTLDLDGEVVTISSYNGQKLVVSQSGGGITLTATYQKK